MKPRNRRVLQFALAATGALAFGEQLSPLGLAGGALILASGVAVIADTR